MARDHARIHLSIWSDDDWRDLTPTAQWLYLHLLSSPTLNYAGVADWRPNRIMHMAQGWTADVFDRAASLLETTGYVVIDRDSEEVLIRSFLRHDGILSKPNVAIAFCKAWQGIASRVIRGVITWELIRLETDQPDQNAWTNQHSQPWLAEVLDGSPIAPEDAFGLTNSKGSVKGSRKGLEVAK